MQSAQGGNPLFHLLRAGGELSDQGGQFLLPHLVQNELEGLDQLPGMPLPDSLITPIKAKTQQELQYQEASQRRHTPGAEEGLDEANGHSSQPVPTRVLEKVGQPRIAAQRHQQASQQDQIGHALDGSEAPVRRIVIVLEEICHGLPQALHQLLPPGSRLEKAFLRIPQ